ncbi:hypothetical protein [Corallococcus sp. EGB]|uniref:hypothetical protein n=1 Tax=Corallococcus sp. EGB TaxID=1521117 RepID=UPI001CC06640|nr:hypothetical protein [Corallococcus sp. EGB]
MKHTKTLLAGAVGLFLLPLTAGAAPRPCPEQCKPTSSCGLLCDNGGEIIRCSEYGICSGLLQVAPSEPQASAQQPAPAQADDAELVCRAPVEQAQG